MIGQENLKRSEDIAPPQVGDVEIANLYVKLKKINGSVSNLKNASMFDKAQHAENALNEARDLMAGLVFAVHSLKNEIARLSKK